MPPVRIRRSQNSPNAYNWSPAQWRNFLYNKVAKVPARSMRKFGVMTSTPGEFIPETEALQFCEESAGIGGGVNRYGWSGKVRQQYIYIKVNTPSGGRVHRMTLKAAFNALYRGETQIAAAREEMQRIAAPRATGTFQLGDQEVRFLFTTQAPQ